jgi:nicotinamide mononucleotide transporter
MPAGNALKRAALYTALSAAATLALLPFSPWTEALGAATGALCVWLAARSDPWTWPIGIANNLLYLVVFWSSGLYADSLLQIFYAAVAVYGIWRWRSGRGAAAVRPVASVSRREALLLAAVGVVFATALAVTLDRTTPSTVPWADAITTTLSLAAQWLMGRRFLENWWVWIAVDLLYVPLYLYKGLAVTAVLYAIFLAICIQGLLHWRREMGQAAG